MEAKGVVLIDFPRKEWKWHCHMVADSLPLLHKFAQELGLQIHWFENKRGKNRPHYDLKSEMVPKALEHGAIQVSSEELLEFLKKHYENS